MADIICRWRNPSPKTVCALVHNLPHIRMSSSEFRNVMGTDFFHTPYQLACQLGLYYEENNEYTPRFDHDITEEEALEYLRHWIKCYYAPNPYTKSLKSLSESVFLIEELVMYLEKYAGKCPLKEALQNIFQDKMGNTDIITNCLNWYSDIITVKDGLATLVDNYKKTKYMTKEEFFKIFDAPSKTTLNNSDSLQQIFYGAPGTGKSYTINHTTGGEDVIRTTFHPDTDYSTFVGAYKPTTIEETVMTVIGTKAVPVENADGTLRKESKIIYEFVAQAFLQAYVKAWKKVAEAEGEPKKQFLVIEEINRGNCAQIFGDLFQLLDRNDSGFSDYPIQADADMKRQLQKAFCGIELENKEALNSLYEGRNVADEVINGDILLLPNNLYIWATMNTSDQSLFPIDSAFKRRWDWTYMPISNANKDWTIKVGNDNYDWWSFLERMNDKIGSTTNSEDKKLGYFFCKAQNGVIPVEKFVGKVIFYLWNDVFKDYEFSDPIFDDKDGSKLTFAKFYTEEGRNSQIVTDKVAVFLKNLGLEPSFIEPDAESDSVQTPDSNNQMDYSKYSLNGEGSYSKGGLVYETVKRYATAHAESTADEIVNIWLQLGINVPYLVETAAEHEQRKQQTSDSRFDQKSKMLELPNHEVIYISNQFNVQRIEDFIEKVNAQPWHLTLAKI